MTHHPRYQKKLENLFLTVFVYIDDWLKPYHNILPQQPAQKASYSEILTIAIVGEILAQPFESTWYWIVSRKDRELCLESHPDEIRVEAPRGSVLLLDSMVWHSAGANHTDTVRIALICICCRSFVKPMFEFVHHLKPEVLERATPERRRLYGFDSWPRPPDMP